MSEPPEFEILIRRKMPFITSLLYGLIIFLLAILLILYVFMIPATHSRSSAEMQTAYYIRVVPDALKLLSSYSFFGLLIVVPLYFRTKLYRQPATLQFHTDKLSIIGRKIKLDIPVNKINKVFCNDLTSFTGMPKGKLQVVIVQKGDKETAFLLKEYEEGGEIIDCFGKLEGVKMAGYEKEMFSLEDE